MFPEHLHMKTVCGIVWCCTGSAEETEQALEPDARPLGKPLFDHVGPMPFPVVQSMFDPLYSAWSAVVLEGRLLHGTERRSHRAARRARVQDSDHALHDAPLPVNGAAHRVGEERHGVQLSRCALCARSSSALIPIRPTRTKITKWGKDYWDALHPFAAGGAYVNFMMEEGRGARASDLSGQL